MILGLDQGTSSSRAVLMPPTAPVPHGPARAPADLSPSRLGRTGPRGIWLRRPKPCALFSATLASTPPPFTASASPTSAKPPSCGTGRTGDPSPTPSSGRIAAPPGLRELAASERGPQPRSTVRRKDRPGPRRLFLRQQDALDAATMFPARALKPQRRRARLRHRRHLAHLETHRRRVATSPTSPTPPAPCSSTSTPHLG